MIRAFALTALAITLVQEPELGLETALETARADLEENAAWAPLGEQLFENPALSSDGKISCTSCHDRERGFADSEPTSVGVGGQRTLRNTPTLLNRVLGERFMWDGRVATLEEQVLMPIENEREMGTTVEAAVARLAADAKTAAAFQAAFGAPPSREHLARALAAFVRTLTYGDTPFDRFRRTGDISALTKEERAGMWFFESRGGCWRCHTEPNFSDEDLHNTGVGAKDGVPEPARAAITGDAADSGRFKTPTLRGLVDTAPYMHDGSLATLEDVVAFYREGGGKNSHLSPRVAPLDMTDAEAANLAAFLRALTRR
ncbi:MAG: cytochrome-c peroxidase [bacterium]|nr:cytochrome-c peroxidase [bacterium]